MNGRVQFLIGTQALRKRLLSHRQVQFGICGIIVGFDEQGADNQGQRTKQIPPNERQIQNENIELFSSCHVIAEFNGPMDADIGIVCENVRNHAIGIGFDDSWNNEQQRPQHKQDASPEHCQDHRAICPRLKYLANMRKDCIALGGTDKVVASTDFQRVAEEDTEDKRKKHEPKDDEYDPGRHGRVECTGVLPVLDGGVATPAPAPTAGQQKDHARRKSLPVRTAQNILCPVFQI